MQSFFMKITPKNYTKTCNFHFKNLSSLEVMAVNDRYQFLLALLKKKSHEQSSQKNQSNYHNYQFQPFFHL